MTRRDLSRCLENAFSRERLGPYRSQTNSRFEACQAYFWNLDLCESLYPVLNAVEVVVRNELDETIASYTGNSWWFSDASLLGGHELDSYEKVHNRLNRESYPVENPTRGHYIADLPFGFWTGLLHSFYERDQKLWPTLLTNASNRQPFGEAPNTLQNRQDFFKRIDSVRKLRNRVFHHEPVWNRDSLTEDYSTSLQVIGWVEPDLEDAFREFCRFQDVYEGGAGSTDRIGQIMQLFEENGAT